MATWNVAVVREQGQVFAVVLVQDHVIDNPAMRADVIASWQNELGCRVALLGERRFRTYGPNDIVRWMRNVHPSRLPWRRMTMAA